MDLRACLLVAMLLWNVAAHSIAQNATEPSNPPSSEQVDQWIVDLASSEFLVRDSATQRLAMLDFSYSTQLAKARQATNDPEVTVRLAGVLAKLKYEHNQRVIKTFQRDSDMNETHSLEGWRSFSRVAGANRSAKRLFLKLYAFYPDLVEHELVTPEDALACAGRVVAFIRQGNVPQSDPSQGRPPEAVDGLALLYALCVAGDAQGSPFASTSASLFRLSPFNQIIRDPQAKRPMELMVPAWAATLGELQPYALLLMMENELSSARTVALQMIDPTNNDFDAVGLAMQALYRFGSPEDLPAIEKWLDRHEVVVESERISLPQARVPGALPRNPGLDLDQRPNPTGPRGLVYTVEVGDTALLACMKIARMEIRDAFPNLVPHQYRGYGVESIALPKDDAPVRDERLDSYRKNREKMAKQ